MAFFYKKQRILAGRIFQVSSGIYNKNITTPIFLELNGVLYDHEAGLTYFFYKKRVPIGL